ncbi:MAG: sporulation protein [Ruminococcaceae bacterium]|nr:sporulation protein [Oscillospiraceae bacterium]
MAAYELNKPQTNNIILEDRTRLSVTGVEDVDSFDETVVVMYTSGGTLVIRGNDLRLEKLSLDIGELSLTGNIDSMQYEHSAGGGSFFSRLFG